MLNPSRKPLLYSNVGLAGGGRAESGRPGEKVRNSNGTYDYGAMQINTVSLAELRPYGIHESHVLTKGCYPYYLAAWRIAGHLRNNAGDIWQRAANYHSKTPYYNSVYRLNHIRRAAKIANRFAVKQDTPELTVNGSAQTAKLLKKMQSDRIQPLFSAYSAPIRVKGFEKLNTYPLQPKQTGSVRVTPASTGW